MAVLIRDIIASAYVLLDNPTEEELPYITALEQYAVTSSEMQSEAIYGYRNSSISKATVTFDDTGIANDTLTDFVEDVVFLQFQGAVIEEVPVNMLDISRNNGLQAVAFFEEVTGSLGARVKTKKIALANALAGDLTVWYEPRANINRAETANTEIEDSYRFFMSTRLAYKLSRYVHFRDPIKQANKPVLSNGLREDASYAKDLYKTAVNRIGAGNRPYARIPYMA